MIRPYLLLTFLFIASSLPAQDVSLIIEKATFNTRYKYLDLELSFANNSKDTIYLLNSGSHLFRFSGSGQEDMGLQMMPYSIVSKNIPGCEIGPNTISIMGSHQIRKMIPADDFIAINPGGKRTLNSVHVNADQLCIKTPTASFSIAISYQVIKANQNYFSETEVRELIEAKSELESVTSEIDSMNGKIKFQTEYYLKRLSYYASYNLNVERLATEKITSKPIMVTLIN